MESPMFTDDDEPAETPRTHIQQFLTNVTTDPMHSLSSKRRRQTRSFARTPEKSAKSKEKNLLRLSTSLPSPGSLITPKTNLQHLLLGSDSAKTPLDRRVASARSARRSNKSLLHQAPLEWGQKVSLSPMFTSSPSRLSSKFDADSPSKSFKRPQHHRSFRIPDLPANSNVQSVSHLKDRDANNEEAVSNSDIRNDQVETASPLVVQRNTQHSSSRDALRVLEEINRSLQLEKAKQVYDLRSSSTEEESDYDYQSGSKLRDISMRKSITLNKTKTPTKSSFNTSRRRSNASYMDEGLDTLDSSLKKNDTPSRLKTRNASIAAENASSLTEEIIYNDDNDPTQFQSLSASKRLGISSAHKEGSSIQKSMNDESNMRMMSLQPEESLFENRSAKSFTDNDINTSRSKSSMPGTSFQNQSAKGPSKNDIETSRNEGSSFHDERVHASTPNTPVNVSNSQSKRSSRGNIVAYFDDNVRKQGVIDDDVRNSSLSNTTNKSTTKASEPDSPLMVQPLRKITRSASKLLNRSEAKNPRKDNEYPSNSNQSLEMHTPTVRRSPRKSINKSEAGRRSSGKRSAIDVLDQDIDFNDQFSDMEVPMDLSRAHSTKRRKTNSLNDMLNETNPSSSTPFKRSKSVFSSTRMQNSVSDNLTSAKESEYPSNKSIAIGDLSPIRPYVEDGQEDASNSGMETQSRSKQLSVSKNKEHHDSHTAEVDEVDEANFTPMKTPVIDMNKRPLHLSGMKSDSRPSKAARMEYAKAKEFAVKKAKPLTATVSGKRKLTAQTSVFPRRMVKSMAELYSSMKIDKEALNELEDLTEQFMTNTVEAAESYSQHAGRKTITEADIVLMMKKQRLITSKEDLYDLIRKYLPMELRCQLIPCFPSHS